MELEHALQECKKAAQRGYQLAREEQNLLHTLLEESRTMLENADEQQEKYTRLPREMVISKQRDALKGLEALERNLARDLELHRKNLAEFHIVVFGRTMVGKSTLMEILTHGNGASIGKGGQRTTRDVRSYHWQGMRVTDVPGIGSFEGREDDRLAMEAAKTADLILFLVSDDAPQQDEAAKLAELRDLGKPILILMNVKLTLDGYPERRGVLLKKLAKKMADTVRLTEIEEQFRGFASVYEQDWSDIAFVHSHLNAAYIGDATRAADSELYELSNFSAVESFLLEKIRNEGAYYRLKTFVEAVRVPMWAERKRIWEANKELRPIIDSYAEKIEEIIAFRDEMIDDVMKDDMPDLGYYASVPGVLEEVNLVFNDERGFVRADEIDLHQGSRCHFYVSLVLKTGRYIWRFAADHYDDFGDYESKILSRDLNKIINDECSKYIQRYAERWERKRKELADKLTTDAKFSSATITIEDIAVGGGFGDTASSALKVASLASWLIPGGFFVKLGFSLVTGVLSSIFGSDDSKKIRDFAWKIQEQVISPLRREVFSQVLDVLSDKIIDEGIDGFGQTLVDVRDLLIDIYNAGNAKGRKLNERLDYLDAVLDEAERELIRG